MGLQHTSILQKMSSADTSKSVKQVQGLLCFYSEGAIGRSVASLVGGYHDRCPKVYHCLGPSVANRKPGEL